MFQVELQESLFSVTLFGMSRKHPSLFWKASLVGAIAVVLYGFVLVPFSVLEIPKLKTQDLFFTARRFFHLQKPDLKDLVLVNVDDESIKRIHERWPFPRRRYAELLERLIPLRPRLIAFDFIFSGVGDPADDLMLAQALQKSGNVILASFVDSEQNYMVPLQEFRDAARSVGVVNKVLDRDLYVRRSGLFYRDVSGAIIGWPWEMEIWAQDSNAEPRAYEINSKGLRFPVQNMQIPFYGQKTAMVNYRFDLGDLEAVSFWKVLDGKQPRDRFAGKIVLVGVTSRALHDYYHTPLGLMPGVLVNANFLVNLLARDFVKKIPTVIDGLFLFIWVWLAAYLGLRDQLLRGLLAMLGATAIFAGGFFLLFLKNYLGDYFSPFLAGWGAFIAIALYRYFRTLLENVQLRGKVITDPLTGLYNRRFLESRIDLELEKLASPKKDRKLDLVTDLSILMIDIDDFKKINDTYGHQFGDDVLKTISFLIKENIRKDDLAARFGGEEFCVILAHTTKEEAGRAAEKIRSNVEGRKFNYVNRMTRFTVSVGLASAKADDLSASRALIRAADEALYEAKRNGKNRVCLYQAEKK
ncbi:MAG: diguanylate cyclase [Candidatus Omnitrophica bacterium]|nr:diguanylate cyclase [Candidatus Omnitrophota bacterium]